MDSARREKLALEIGREGLRTSGVEISEPGATTQLADPQTGIASILLGDSRQVLERLPEDLVQTTVTSPPYWSLRNYEIEGQIGLEDSLDQYIASLVAVFDEVRRVTREDGTLWLNIGDSFTSGGRTWRAPDRKNPVRALVRCIARPLPLGRRLAKVRKSLAGELGIPLPDAS